ncbi:DUF3870 domain-containing protein [Actinomadura sp. SCN-SB]|uniref:DUF3870 domain-containing protein n=1 Tax=Actinomadura sp. SCN-SB TaxID=3373092 RepID=UPI003752FE2F
MAPNDEQAGGRGPGRELIVIGYGKVPATSASHATNVYFALALRVDTERQVITEVDSTAVTGLVRRWIAEIVTGADIAADPGPILDRIDDCYLGVAAGAIKQAVLDAWRRYGAHRSSRH